MNTRFRFLALAISCWLVAGGAAAFSAGNETIYYAVESKGVQCGFGVTTLSREVIGGRDTLVLDSEVRVKLTLGGAPVEMVLRFKEHVEPESGQFRRVESEITQEWTGQRGPLSDHPLVFRGDFSETKLRFAVLKGLAQSRIRRWFGKYASWAVKLFEVLTDRVFRLMK